MLSFLAHEDPSLEKTRQMMEALNEISWSYWTENVLYSWQWWFMLLSALIALYACFKLIDRNRLVSICLYGVFMLFIVTYLDTIGSELVLWEYPYMVIPWGARIICIDILITVGYVAIYQKWMAWKSYFLAIVSLAVVYAFILEPVAEALHIYIPIRWSHWYSFPVYIALGVLVKWLIDGLMRVESKQE
jgi:hypothetical protein